MSGVMDTMALDYRRYTELKIQGEKERIERERAERAKNKFQPESLKALDEKITEQDILFLESLACEFYEEVPASVYKNFLTDNCYSEADFVRVMNKLKRMKDKINK